MADSIKQVIIGYGSESGNARMLAQRLGEQEFLLPYSPRVMELNEVALESMEKGDVLFIISCSFGDGEPPANAEIFFDNISKKSELSQLNYAIFGLGDTAYPNFCGFTKAADLELSKCGANSIINRVDADVNYIEFFDIWLSVVEKLLAGDYDAGRNLSLRVSAYGENNAFNAALIERRRLNHSLPAAWHFRLNIENSNILYRAGDTVFLLPENEDHLLNNIANWLGQEEACCVLKNRELRLISKNVLRELAQLSHRQDLKEMLKIKNRKQLECYLYGADILDILQDFCTPNQVRLENLEAILPICQPRAYSIASASNNNYMDLCIREVDYQHNGRAHHGTATHWLLNHQGSFRIFNRANVGFYLPSNIEVPVIFIGTGTGIAPLIGLLREIAQKDEQRKTILIFGEKRSKDDFLYRDELENFVDIGILGRMITAFSRDGESKYYVQHAIEENADYISEFLAQGAHVYICGNRQYLEKSVASALNQLDYHKDDDHSVWQHLIDNKRLHLELY